MAKFGPKAHVLINNAALFVFESVETASGEDWDRSAAVNIKGHALATKHCIPLMKARYLATHIQLHALPSYSCRPCDDHKPVSVRMCGRMRGLMNDQAAGGGSIVFQGSISSFKGQPNCATYATAKGAIVQLARNCAFDLSKYNIRCNSICAGTIEVGECVLFGRCVSASYIANNKVCQPVV